MKYIFLQFKDRRCPALVAKTSQKPSQGIHHFETDLEKF